MKKIVEVNGITYDIQVILNWTVEKRINGIKVHKVVITSPNSVESIEYLVQDLEKELPLIENELGKINNTTSEEEKLLKELGYK